MNKDNQVTEENEETVTKPAYEQLLGPNSNNEKVNFVWDQIPEELI